jgi:Spy/CpxP family protein refolding chaperone
MSRNQTSLRAISLFLFTALLLSLTLSTARLTAQTSSSANQPQQPQQLRRGNAVPCWRQAGIEKSVMEQRWAIERDTRSQIENVCTNSSLTPQQKRQQIREIHEQARQKMEGLITTEQQQALTACQQERGTNHPAANGQGLRGPCGELPNGAAHPGSNTAPENGNPQPANPPSQN